MTHFLQLRRLGCVVILAVILAQFAEAKPEPTHRDVSYGQHPHQLIDVYLPSEDGDPTPVLIWYGGVFQASKHAAELPRFLSKRIAVIAVETRSLADGMAEGADPPVKWVMDDACRAIQFVRYNAKKWNLDPTRIALGGGSQGALPALYVGCSADRADLESEDPVARLSTKVTCVAAYRCQPTIDPQRMQEWVAGVKWGAPAFGCSFEQSLERRQQLLGVIKKWSPDWLLDTSKFPDKQTTRPSRFLHHIKILLYHLVLNRHIESPLTGFRICRLNKAQSHRESAFRGVLCLRPDHHRELD